jgi:hypothetical protein
MQHAGVSVPMHKIPNFGLGKVKLRHITRCFLPRLYNPGSSPAISQQTFRVIYDQCMRYAVLKVIPGQQSHWPVSYAAAMEQIRDSHGRFHFGSVDIGQEHLHQFAQVFLARLAEHPGLEDAFFVHELRGSKGVSTHDPRFQAEREACFDDIMAFMDERLMNPSDWQVDVALELRVPGHIAHFSVSGFHSILQHTLPSATAEQINALEKSPTRHRVDLAASLKDLGGFRTEPRSRGKRDGISYINVYCSEKSAAYQLFPGGLYRLHSTRELLPGKLGKLIQEVNTIGTVVQACSGSETSAGLEGNARFEVRIPLLSSIHGHRRFPEDLIQRCIIAYPIALWWYALKFPSLGVFIDCAECREFKFYRLAAIHYVLQDMQASSNSFRSFIPSLTLGALMVYLLDSLFHRPVDGKAELNLLESCCVQVESEPNSDSSGSDDNWDLVPLMYDQGLYFAADIIQDKFFRLATTACNTMDRDYLSKLYRVNSIEELQQEFLVSQAMLPKSASNHTRIPNRRTHTMNVQYLQDETNPPPDINFGLHDRGVELRHVIRPQGRDVDENSDIDLAEDGTQGNIDDILNDILRQFPYDIFSKGPNHKSSSSGSYLIMQKRDIETSTVDIFKSLDLSGIFETVQVRRVTPKFWDETLFKRFFPDKNVKAKPRGKLQGFPYLTYYTTWISVINRLNTQQVNIVRDSLLKEFSSLHWVPHAQTDRLWATSVMPSAEWTTYPENATGKPAPQLAINPRFARLIDVVVGTRQRQETGEEDELGDGGDVRAGGGGEEEPEDDI